MKQDLLDRLRTDEERAIEKEWIEVAERRLAEVESGAVKPIPAAEVHKRVKEKLRAARASRD